MQANGEEIPRWASNPDFPNQYYIRLYFGVLDERELRSDLSAFFFILTETAGEYMPATIFARSPMERSISDPTLYGQHILPRNNMPQSQTAKSAAYR